MEINKLKERLDFEINKRIESDNWDMEIASKVIRAESRNRKKTLYISSVSSFAFAALMLIIFAFGLTTSPDENLYEQFITKQVRQTYSSVIGEDTGNLPAENNGDTIFTGEIDSVIDNVLSMR
ncbi:MAG: hypothetical protein JW864_01405 [Spirochaetes bacterium]|nr:hypothetical protein [Spirochaetota bacterium]